MIGKYNFGIFFHVVILVLLAAFVLGQRIYPSERDTVTEESITFTGTFYRVLADGTEEEIPVPGRCDVPAGELLVIRSVLPQDYKENTIAIRSSLENVRIYIGGELRTVYDTENTRPFGKNSASRYVFCETSGEDAGKEVRIELQSFTHKYSGVVNTVYCGDRYLGIYVPLLFYGNFDRLYDVVCRTGRADHQSGARYCIQDEI